MNILLIDDEANIRITTRLAIESNGHDVTDCSSSAEALERMENEQFDGAFLDLRLGEESGLDLLPRLLEKQPDLTVVIFTAYAALETAVEAIKRGAYDYLPKPFTPDQVKHLLTGIAKHRSLLKQVKELESRLRSEMPLVDFDSSEPSMQKVIDLAGRAAKSEATLLILGESGTGKTALARAIHAQSTRKNGPFMVVNCPSLSRELLESELFGHMKGSFTGALRDTWGKVAAAEGGTLFLDEIGELPIEIQPKLLRLLQEREYERVGETKTRRADVRVIAATNRNLEQACKEGSFREDLFYRLNVLTFNLPPLRERPADLFKLADLNLKFFAKQTGKKLKGFSEEAKAGIRSYPWPGNLRELRNAIERAVILSTGPEIGMEELPEAMSGKNETAPITGELISLEALEREHIRRVLAKTDNLEDTARILGIDPATLYRKRKKYGLT